MSIDVSLLPSPVTYPSTNFSELTLTFQINFPLNENERYYVLLDSMTFKIPNCVSIQEILCIVREWLLRNWSKDSGIPLSTAHLASHCHIIYYFGVWDNSTIIGFCSCSVALYLSILSSPHPVIRHPL